MADKIAAKLQIPEQNLRFLDWANVAINFSLKFI